MKKWLLAFWVSFIVSLLFLGVAILLGAGFMDLAFYLGH